MAITDGESQDEVVRGAPGVEAAEARKQGRVRLHGLPRSFLDSAAEGASQLLKAALRRFPSTVYRSTAEVSIAWIRLYVLMSRAELKIRVCILPVWQSAL